MLVPLLFFGAAGCAAAMLLPEYIHSCSKSDPNLSDCAVRSAQESISQFSKGDPSRGLKPLDPLDIGPMTVYIPNKQGFRVTFKNNTLRGLADVVMERLIFDFENKIVLVRTLATLDMTNSYELSGRVFGVPIKSNGPSEMHFINARLDTTYWYDDVVGEDGNIHWKIIKHDTQSEIEKAIFRLENFLNDKNIGDTVNRVLNNMWREVVAGTGPTFRKALSEAVVERLTVLLAQVSFDEMFTE